MSEILKREIRNYSVDVFQSSSADFDRVIFLELRGSEPNTVIMRFGGTVPVDFILNTGQNSWMVHLSAGFYKDMLHLLQTERPVYFTAREIGVVRFAGLTTGKEQTGEGFRDRDLPTSLT